jgi:hypothetical protein
LLRLYFGEMTSTEADPQMAAQVRTLSSVSTSVVWAMCPACARKHFAPMIKAQRSMDEVLQKLATDAMKKLDKTAAGLMCAAVKRAS